MSPSTDVHEMGDENKKAKKAKPARACDVCRRKRIRCDGVQASGVPCLNCVTFKSECTYDEPPKKHGPPKGYTKILEERVALLENMLKKAGIDFEKELGAPLDKDSIRQGVLPNHPSTLNPGRRDIPSHSLTSSGASLSQTNPTFIVDGSESEFSDDSDVHHPVLDKLEGLSLSPMRERFLGKSSEFGLVKAALVMRAKNAEEDLENSAKKSENNARRQFWSTQPWEITNVADRSPDYRFPEPDLLNSLLKLFFAKIHPMSPVLHWPTFERSVLEGLHRRDHRFGAVVMMVCATASRYSDDPRVLLEGQESLQSSGWKWFNEVQVTRKPLMTPTTLYDLQLCCLFTLFLVGSSSPHAAWIVIGNGIRMAQDVGAHRRKFYGNQRTVKSELWKRAFWVLVLQDRGLSAALGRHHTLSPEEIDVDFPVECDDEYWIATDPKDAFKQPPGKPSRIVYFNHMLKMTNILSDTLRTLYSDHRHRSSSGRSTERVQHMIAEIDSALNKWFEQVPDHLRWMPQDGDPIAFRQSAMLHISYYRNQILVHRPFISPSQTHAPLSMSCMAICSNAARCTINIADVTRTRGGYSPGTISPTFTASVILLLQIFGMKQSGTLIDPERAMSEVRRGLDVLETLGQKWSVAGACANILRGLATFGKLPLPPPRSTFKRKRDTDLSVPPVLSGRRPTMSSTIKYPTTSAVSGTPPQPLPHPAHPVPRQLSEIASMFLNGAPNDLQGQSNEPFDPISFPIAHGQVGSQLAGPSRIMEQGSHGVAYQALPSNLQASFYRHPGAHSSLNNSASDLSTPRTALAEHMMPPLYLASSTPVQGNDSIMLDQFMANIADPNLTTSLRAGFYPSNWQQAVSSEGPCASMISEMGGIGGNIMPIWTEADFGEWGSYFHDSQDFAGGETGRNQSL